MITPPTTEEYPEPIRLRLPRARTLVDDKTMSAVRRMLVGVAKAQLTRTEALAFLRELSTPELGELGRDLLRAALEGHAGEHSLRALHAIGLVLGERERAG